MYLHILTKKIDYKTVRNKMLKHWFLSSIPDPLFMDRSSNHVKVILAHFAVGLKRYSKVIVVRLLLLRRDFETLIMENGESIADFLSRAMAIVSKISSCGEKITYQTIVEKMLRSLTP